MLNSVIPAALLGASAVSAAPFSFPLGNGFPDIKIPSPALVKTETQAQGTLPNSPLAKSLAPEDITNWELVAFNEIFEVAFFTSLLHNVTAGVSGYEISDDVPGGEEYVVESLRAIRAQEELHALGANAILEAAGSTPIQPCEYMFPSVSFDTAIDTARMFTDLVLGTLQAVQYSHAVNGDPEYIPLIGGVIGQEGEQVGAFRAALGLVPSELPFLTTSTGPWAYSAVNQLFVVPGSCPNANIIDVPIFGPLTVGTPEPKPKNQNIEFSFTNNGADLDSISLVYVNQQNLPIVEKPMNVKSKGNMVTFEAALPYEEYIMNGLTIAVVTNSAGPFADATAVADATLFGPGLIEIN